MSYTSTATANQNVSNLLAQVRALKYAVIHKAIGYDEAKMRAEKLLEEVNAIGEKISKKYNRRFRKIIFSDL